MKTYLLLPLILLSVWSVQTNAQSPASTSLAENLGEKIRTSQRDYPNSSVDMGTAVAVIDASMQDVEDIVTDYENYAHFMPNFSKSKVLSRRGSRALIYMEAGIAKNTLTLWAQLKVGAKDKDGKRIIRAKMIDGNMDSFDAVWTLEKVTDTQTLVRFRLHVEPSIPLPSSLYSRQNEKAAKKTLRAIRKRALAKG